MAHLWARVWAWCVRTLAGDHNRLATGNTQLESRNPMFVLALPGELLAFAARTPALAPLFQLPPTMSIYPPAPCLTRLSQPPI